VRIISVTARQFGPFTDQTLELAEGLTLVWGSNEAGKSSWHGALYAGLCGLRRGKGPTRGEDRAFRDRHRPWDGGGWAVEALIELADGRRIRLQHDLDGGRESRAWDDQLGRDVSAEITHDGSPDGSRWLGLDRRTFLSVACVRQGEIVAVRDDNSLLREYLQRAAASASTEGTAAAAIDRIGAALSEMVGSDRASSTKPLRRALDRLAKAGASLVLVREQREEHQRAVEEAELLRQAAELADRHLARARVARLAADLARCRTRLARVRELQSRHPEGPPARLQDDTLIQVVAGALRAWDTRPDVVDLDEPSAAELRRQLDELPEPPSGDCAVHQSVLDAHRILGRSAHALELHDAQQPTPPEPMPAGDLSADSLRDLARALDAPVPVLDPVLDGRRRQLQAELDRRRGRRKVGLAVLVTSVVCGLGGLAALLFGQMPIAAGLWVLTSVGVAWWGSQARRGVEVRLLEDLRTVDSQLGEQRHGISLVLRQQRAAREAAAARGVKADPAALHALAVRIETDERLRTDREHWAQMRLRRLDEVAAAQEAVEDALRLRGVDATDGVEAAIKQYEDACLLRSEQNAIAGRRAGLLRELSAREAAEHAREQSLNRRASAVGELMETGERCGMRLADVQEVSSALRAWQADRLEAARQFEKDSRDWSELEHLLDGATIERLTHEEAALAAQVEDVTSRLGGEDAAAPGDAAVLDAELPRLETEAQRKAGEAAEARGKIAQRAGDLGSIVESEEELAAAEADLARVRRLEHTLDVTLDFLKRAQDRVHRDLAPILANTIRGWLSTITDGRYVDVRVDPESLGVSVCDPDGQWRNAELLSQGTSEQIYLALRMAMALHLTPRGEPCPLIFDEVTVQSDSPRTEAMLRTLHDLASDHQVILFSQEQHVLDWAERHATPRDRVVRLDSPPHALSGRLPRELQ
jgi:exonuclease SbcC